MGRAVSQQLTKSIDPRPTSGVFGSGNIEYFPLSGTFTYKTPNVRVRIFGAGGPQVASATTGGGGGGFGMLVVTGQTVGSTAAVTVGASGSTSSFGALLSVTSGTNAGAGGTSTGGNINYTGGSATANGSDSGGGSVANLFGNGSANGTSGSSGGGGNINGNPVGGSGLTMTGARSTTQLQSLLTPSYAYDSIDFYGTGGGGVFDSISPSPGLNGGGGGAGGQLGVGRGGAGGFPGGGVGAAQGAGPTIVAQGGRGLVIVEW